jgi:hypothetical protein
MLLQRHANSLVMLQRGGTVAGNMMAPRDASAFVHCTGLAMQQESASLMTLLHDMRLMRLLRGTVLGDAMG